MNELRDNRKLDEQVDQEVEIVIHHHRVVAIMMMMMKKIEVWMTMMTLLSVIEVQEKVHLQNRMSIFVGIFE